MRKKINQTNFMIAGATALFVSLAGNVRAIPMSLQNQSVSDAVQSANLTEPDQSVATLTALQLAKSLKEEKVVVRKEAALLAKSLKKEEAASRKEAAQLAKASKAPKMIASRDLVASNGGRAKNGVIVMPLPLMDQNPPLIYLPHNGTPGLTPYVYQDPAALSLGIPQSGTTAQVSSAAVGVPDGGATAAMMAGAFGGLVFLRKKLETGFGLSKTGI
jgi:VPDSG-CTERM motif